MTRQNDRRLTNGRKKHAKEKVFCFNGLEPAWIPGLVGSTYGHFSRQRGQNESLRQDPKKPCGENLFLKSFGGYVVISQAPHEEYKIINENKEILADFARKGNPAKIDGRLPCGAYFLFIEKIDGQPYSGGK